jgi:hypothetical protein
MIVPTGATLFTKGFIFEIRTILTAWEKGITPLEMEWDELYAIEDAVSRDMGLVEDDDIDDNFCDDVDETFYDPYCGCEIYDNCDYEW